MMVMVPVLTVPPLVLPVPLLLFVPYVSLSIILKLTLLALNVVPIVLLVLLPCPEPTLKSVIVTPVTTTKLLKMVTVITV